MREFHIRQIPLTNKLNPIERTTALQAVIPILDLCLSGNLSHAFNAGFTEAPHVSENQVIMITSGHAAYSGAKLIVDLLTIDENGSPTSRTASYAFFDDIIICVDDTIRESIQTTPAHEVGAEEANKLLNLLMTIK